MLVYQRVSQIFSSDSISETTFKNHDTPAMPVPYLARASSSLSVRRGFLEQKGTLQKCSTYWGTNWCLKIGKKNLLLPFSRENTGNWYLTNGFGVYYFQTSPTSQIAHPFLGPCLVFNHRIYGDISWDNMGRWEKTIYIENWKHVYIYIYA